MELLAMSPRLRPQGNDSLSCWSQRFTSVKLHELPMNVLWNPMISILFDVVYTDQSIIELQHVMKYPHVSEIPMTSIPIEKERKPGCLINCHQDPTKKVSKSHKLSSFTPTKSHFNHMKSNEKSHETSIQKPFLGEKTVEKPFVLEMTMTSPSQVVQLLLKHADEESADNSGCRTRLNES